MNYEEYQNLISLAIIGIGGLVVLYWFLFKD